MYALQRMSRTWWQHGSTSNIAGWRRCAANHLSSGDSMCSSEAEKELQSRGGADTKLDFSFAASRIDLPTCAGRQADGSYTHCWTRHSINMRRNQHAMW